MNIILEKKKLIGAKLYAHNFRGIIMTKIIMIIIIALVLLGQLAC